MKNKIKIIFLLFFINLNADVIFSLATKKAFNRFIQAYPMSVVWVYGLDKDAIEEKIIPGDFKVVNNPEYGRVRDVRKAIDTVILNGRYPRSNDVRIGSFNRLDQAMSKVARRYGCDQEDCILFFYRGKCIEEYRYSGVLKAQTLENLIRKVFFETTLFKKRSRRPGRINSRADERYSFPRPGASLGWGVPFWDWPGYWYGGRGCFGGWGSGYGCGGCGWGGGCVNIGLNFFG